MGIFAAFLAAIFASSKDLTSKRISFKVSGTISAFASFLFALPFYLILLFILYLLGFENFFLTREIFILILLRSITDTFAELFKMHAMSFTDISLLASVFALYPLILLFVGPLITGDQVSTGIFAATIIIAFGSQTLVWKSALLSSRHQIPGILLAMASACCFALNTSFDRLAAQKSTPVFASFSMTLLACIFLSIFVFFSKEKNQIAQLISHKGNFFLRGLFEVAFMSSKLTALRYLTPSYAVGIQNISLLFTIISGALIFKEKDLERRLAAGLLIFTGIIIMLVFG
jgi:drug/metabolite transporter (DMT)-like permease